MKVEELIKKLEELKNKLGNVDVTVIVEDIDRTNTGILPINEVDISTDIDGSNPEIYIGYFARNDKDILDDEEEKNVR